LGFVQFPSAAGAKTSGGSACPAITPINPPIASPTSGKCSNSGCVDSSFNSTGFVLTNTDGSISPTIDFDAAVSVQQIVMPDGSTRILAIGQTTNPISGAGQGIALVRYNNDGSLDTGFGNGGITIVFLPSGSASPMDGVLDAQGNIVVLSNANGGAIVSRFHPDGTLDASFNGTGSSALLTSLFPQSLVLDPAGNILAAGQYTPNVSRNRQAAYGSVFRLTPSGILDSSFGSAGIATNTAFSSVGALAIETVNSTPYVLFASGSQIARLTPSGVQDSTFAGGKGLASTNACGFGFSIRALRIDTSGNILATGFGPIATNGANKIIASRFTSAGNVDTSFGLSSTSGSGKTGFAVFDLFGFLNISDTATVFTDGSGDFAIGGYASTSSGNYDFVLKVDSTGSLVGGFDNSKGAIALDWGSGINYTASLSNHDLLIEPSDGKIVMGGTVEFTSGPNTGYNFAVARMWP
jgi:uncharacterized delta-60 repeat protein